MGYDNNVLTVKELYDACKQAVKEGKGNKLVYLSSDEEGNEFHPCYFSLLTNPEEVLANLSESMIYEGEDPEQIVLLG